MQHDTRIQTRLIGHHDLQEREALHGRHVQLPDPPIPLAAESTDPLAQQYSVAQSDRIHCLESHAHALV